MRPGHAISLIEAAYRSDLPAEEWQLRVGEAAATAIESALGAMVFRYDVSSGDWVQSELPVLYQLSPAFAHDFFNQPDAPRDVAKAMARAFQTVRFTTSKAIFEKLGAGPVMAPIFERHRIGDLVCINAVDPSGRGCMVTIAVDEAARISRGTSVWHRLAAHISAGNRLRTTLDALARNNEDGEQRAEAVLAPNGKVEHANGPAEARQARDALRDALVRIDAARSGHHDLQRSVDLWRGLVAGRWSLVEHFERDGRRYYLAHKNDPELAPDRALTPRERQVRGYAELGHSNKLIAYSLGLSSSTVATLLGKARKKVGMPPHDGSEQ